MRLDHLLSKEEQVESCCVIQISRKKRDIEIFLVSMRPGDTPVPIPNTMVKPRSADGTILETVWESRRMPGSGGLAQLGERLPCKQEVTSSNLVFSISRAVREKLCFRGARVTHIPGL